jgi:hypothetical protein
MSVFTTFKRRKGKCACAIKLDMTKAYDRVGWNYLHSVVRALGFSERWMTLVMKCVVSVSSSIRVNGVFSEPFKLARGIRQGDSISPYLFLLCAEGLTSMLKNKGPNCIAIGLRVSHHAPSVSYLLFADDCLVFCEASDEGVQRVASISEDY